MIDSTPLKNLLKALQPNYQQPIIFSYLYQPIEISAVNAGSAAAKAEASKVAKYTAIATTHTFIPLAFETLGSWGEQAQRFVADLGKRIAAVTGDNRETMYLRQRLSIAIQRGNALSIRGTLSLDRNQP